MLLCALVPALVACVKATVFLKHFLQSPFSKNKSDAQSVRFHPTQVHLPSNPMQTSLAPDLLPGAAHSVCCPKQEGASVQPCEAEHGQ